MNKFGGIFKDRIEAAKKLILALERYKNNPDIVVLGLLRGGIVPAFEVAKGLGLPLDFIIVRKLGTPGNPELAMGAITEDDVTVFDDEVFLGYEISKDNIDKIIAEEKSEVLRRIKLYRGDYPKIELRGKTALIVDDGIATGTTVRAAIKSCKVRGAKNIIVAVPVCPTGSATMLKGDADEIICIHPSDMLFAVGSFYDDFPQVDDKEVLGILKKAKKL